MRIGSSCAVCVILGLLASFSLAGSAERYQLKRITDDPAQDGFPSWSPDGKHIVFSRNGGEDAPEKTGLWLVSPDGGEPHQLATIIAEHPDWSPDGRYIAFDGDFGNCIQLVAASGGTPIRIVPESIPVRRGGQPKWSPDGSRIAFKEGHNLWVLDVPTGRFDKIFSDQGKLPIPACWSHDGREIYLYLRDAESHDATISAVSATGAGIRRVTLEEASVYRYADLSPDGSLLAVVWCQGRDCDLWIMSPTGGNRVQITAHPSYDDGPSWSPDGKRIAFVSTRSGSFDIWTVEVDAEQVRRDLAAQAR
ncbi:MAG: PD40 domain-containing protein [Krumholzibacteria bacterium]|nr:PD40 domain-containing protein [Candidatus Krumholzibacteria bacterium]